MSIVLCSLNTALASPLHIQGRRVLSGIGKQPRPDTVAVRTLGLDGDEQADPQWHGGPRKAVYAYPTEHYAWWQAQRQEHATEGTDIPLPPGFLGENLTLSGLLETEVHVGDRLVFPDCVLRVTEPRQPCYKLVHIMGYAQAARDMVQHQRCGWYLAVEQAGTLRVGQHATHVYGARQTPVASLLRRHRHL